MSYPQTLLDLRIRIWSEDAQMPNRDVIEHAVFAHCGSANVGHASFAACVVPASTCWGELAENLCPIPYLSTFAVDIADGQGHATPLVKNKSEAHDVRIGFVLEPIVVESEYRNHRIGTAILRTLLMLSDHIFMPVAAEKGLPGVVLTDHQIKVWLRRHGFKMLPQEADCPILYAYWHDPGVEPLKVKPPKRDPDSSIPTRET